MRKEEEREDRLSPFLVLGVGSMAYVLGESFTYHLVVCLMAIYVTESIYGTIRTIAILFGSIVVAVDVFVEAMTMAHVLIYLALCCQCVVWSTLQIPYMVSELIPKRVTREIESYMVSSVPTVVSITVVIATRQVFRDYPSYNAVATPTAFFVVHVAQSIFLLKSYVASVTSSETQVILSYTTKIVQTWVFYGGPVMIYLFYAAWDKRISCYDVVSCVMGPVVYTLETGRTTRRRSLTFGLLRDFLSFVLAVSLHLSTVCTSNLNYSSAAMFGVLFTLPRSGLLSSTISTMRRKTRYELYVQDLGAASCYAGSAYLFQVPSSIVLLVVIPVVLYARNQNQYIVFVPLCAFALLVWEQAYIINMLISLGLGVPHDVTFHNHLTLDSNVLLFVLVVVCFLLSYYLKSTRALRNVWSFSSCILLMVLSTQHLNLSLAILVSSLPLATFCLDKNDENNNSILAPTFFCSCCLCLLVLCDFVVISSTSSSSSSILLFLGSSWMFATFAHILTWISVLHPNRLIVSHTKVLPLHALALVLSHATSSISYSALGFAWTSYQCIVSYKRWKEGQMFL